jgi:hypothetical protein
MHLGILWGAGNGYLNPFNHETSVQRSGASFKDITSTTLGGVSAGLPKGPFRFRLLLVLQVTGGTSVTPSQFFFSTQYRSFSTWHLELSDHCVFSGKTWINKIKNITKAKKSSTSFKGTLASRLWLFLRCPYRLWLTSIILWPETQNC